MLSGNVHKIVVLGIVLIFATVGAQAQQKVYKWVDEDGVVHFSDAPPDESTDTETITTAPAPPPPDRPAPTASQSKQGPFAEDSTSKDTESLPAASAPFAVAEEDISTMSLAALDQRCEVAREEKIAPLREAEIKQCKQDRRNDPNYCDTFYADYGDAGRMPSGVMRPRMFDDLPECADAMNERNRRPR